MGKKEEVIYKHQFPYPEEEECDILLQKFVKCETRFQSDARIVCQPERQAYMECRKKINEMEREMYVHQCLLIL